MSPLALITTKQNELIRRTAFRSYGKRCARHHRPRPQPFIASSVFEHAMMYIRCVGPAILVSTVLTALLPKSCPSRPAQWAFDDLTCMRMLVTGLLTSTHVRFMMINEFAIGGSTNEDVRCYLRLASPRTACYSMLRVHGFKVP